MILVFLQVVPRVKCWMLRRAVVKLVIVIVIEILKNEVCIVMGVCLLLFVFG
jgi:hypothetical protein